MAASSDEMSKLKSYLDGEFSKLKDELRQKLTSKELFKIKYNLTMSQHREVTLQRAKYVFNLPAVQKNFDDLAQNTHDIIRRGLAIGELFSCMDMSVGVKMGVMVWLFGGAILNLGTDDHIKEWFSPLKNLEFTGMFAMSERGHGSNVRGIKTEASYDTKTREFIINTPSADAEKIYIGNALQGNFAAVFAQLYVEGECKGPHCFIVPIRDKEGTLHPGIKVYDMGLKEGLNGVDNGILSFSNVRTPRKNMLNRFAEMSADGQYSTSIRSDSARFNAMLGALVGTRAALVFQALGAMKVGLEIAIKYSLGRRQFGPKNQPEVSIMNYLTHQLRLMPYLASSLALTFAARYSGSILNDEIYLKRPLVENRPLQALAAGLKAYSTWECVQCLQKCRECTGGMGYMEINRLSSLKRDTDVFVTFDGDNMVMLQQVTKELLKHYAEQFQKNKFKGMMSAWKQDISDSVKTSKLAVSTLPVTDVQFILDAFQFKQSRLLRMLARRLMSKVESEGMNAFTAWNECLDHSIELGWCYIKKVTLEQFKLAVDACREESVRAILNTFLRLHAVNIMYNDRAWFLESNYFSTTESKLLRDKMINLCKETKEHSLAVVNAFDHPDVCVGAPIAGLFEESAPWAFQPQSNINCVQSRL